MFHSCSSTTWCTTPHQISYDNEEEIIYKYYNTTYNVKHAQMHQTILSVIIPNMDAKVELKKVHVCCQGFPLLKKEKKCL